MTPHDDVIKWKHFPRNWAFVRGIHRSPVNSPHKGHWRGALMFSLICVWINDWVNNCEAGDLRRYRAHYDVIVMHHGDTQTLVFHEGGFQMPLNCMSVGLVSYYWNENAILKIYSLTAHFDNFQFSEWWKWKQFRSNVSKCIFIFFETIQ